jgi:hypothetical protein
MRIFVTLPKHLATPDVVDAIEVTYQDDHHREPKHAYLEGLRNPDKQQARDGEPVRLEFHA